MEAPAVVCMAMSGTCESAIHISSHRLSGLPGRIGLVGGHRHTVPVTAGGRTRQYRMKVAEPEPGHVLTESDTNSSMVTTTTVTARAACHSSISTAWQGPGGIGGFFDGSSRRG